MPKREPTAEMFLKDVAKHEMAVKHQDGIYRNIRFREPGNSNMWFDLVTWPDFLTIAGDMGTWTFSRMPDMFEFFRSSTLEINADYWSEKLQHGTHGGSYGAKVYDRESYSERLLTQLSEYYGFEDDPLKELTEAVKNEVLSGDCEYDLLIAARDFEHVFPDGATFQFDSCELPDGMVYAYQFIWCLYAIVWGIQRWDAGTGMAG